MPPKYDYQCRVCGHSEESEIRETLIWACPNSDSHDDLTPMHRIYHAPNMSTVWHERMDMTTGQLVSDRKQFEEQLHVASEETSERLQLAHEFVPISLTQDTKTTDEGMDATHNQAVKDGKKESRGKFVWP